MLKNCVFKPSVNTVTWAKAAAIRAVKTMAQAAAGMITVGAAVNEIDWLGVLSVSTVAGLVSVLTSIMGIPEVAEEVTESEEK